MFFVFGTETGSKLRPLPSTVQICAEACERHARFWTSTGSRSVGFMKLIWAMLEADSWFLPSRSAVQRVHYNSTQQQWHSILLWIVKHGGIPICLYARALTWHCACDMNSRLLDPSRSIRSTIRFRPHAKPDVDPLWVSNLIPLTQSVTSSCLRSGNKSRYDLSRLATSESDQTACPPQCKVCWT